MVGEEEEIIRATKSYMENNVTALFITQQLDFYSYTCKRKRNRNM